MLLCEVKIVHRYHARDGSLRGQYPDLLGLVELIPEWMRRAITRPMQPQIALIGYLADDESGVIEPARDQAPRMAAANGHDEIAERVAVPVTVGGDHRIGDVGFLSRWRIVRKPRRNRGDRRERARRMRCILCGDPRCE